MTWTQTATAKGETYYFNSKTGETTWTRPEGVQIALDSHGPEKSAYGSLPLANAQAVAKISGSTSSTANVAGSWRELVSQDGRKYYINTITKATVWEMPSEYRGILFCGGQLIN